MRQAYDEVLMSVVDENKIKARDYGPSITDFFIKCFYVLIPLLIVMTVYYEYTTPKVIKKERINYGRH